MRAHLNAIWQHNRAKDGGPGWYAEYWRNIVIATVQARFAIKFDMPGIAERAKELEDATEPWELMGG